MIVPTEVKGIFTAEKGKTLGSFANYMICEGQQQADQLGYSPLPMNLVQAGATQIAKIPGAGAVDISKCNNPTFKAGDSPNENELAKTAPFPPDCDKKGGTEQCATGTAGTGATETNGNGSTTTGGNGSTTTGGNGSTTTGGSSSTGGGGNGTTNTGSVDQTGQDLASTDQSLGVDEFGNQITDDGSGSSGNGTVGAAAVSSPFTLPAAGSGWLTWVMAGAAALFVAIVALPPVLSRRLRSSDRPGAGPQRF
jgi:phosphate transport system substrate-binding protein